MSALRRHLYPAIEPYATYRLPVSPVHTLYVEECGRRDGQPVVVLHGGPGGGLQPYYRQFFDPSHYRIVLFDQRGSGKSTPHADLRDNTTWACVDDIERIRAHLQIDKWMVFGGSWGSTLALAYAESHPGRVTAMVLRGIFTLRRSELLWFYQEGASHMFPEAFDAFASEIPAVERCDLIGAYHRRLTGDDEHVRQRAARAWTTYEMATSRLLPDPDYVQRGSNDAFALQFARIESHFFVHGGWFESDGQLIDRAGLLKDVPGIIVQGRYDVVCPARSAWQLSRAWPASRLVIVPDAGHTAKEPGIIHELVEATDHFRHHRSACP